ncbi:unnamed protein product [Vitrella brassicaformis CCMP3155]|uniref:FAD synthase n=1 Tax=Vitrella brassicaformis (strain CCMP3155) TaxID=1169540 RepID=A0A0G4F4N6_VITBC|nr:unnamed protein product [Vitrella brassicaformis CCMP3155]|eukprot:CEM06680.1 unnamed protein product [Vitrella brassicaformis CCMP3155]
MTLTRSRGFVHRPTYHKSPSSPLFLSPPVRTLPPSTASLLPRHWPAQQPSSGRFPLLLSWPRARRLLTGMAGGGDGTPAGTTGATSVYGEKESGGSRVRSESGVSGRIERTETGGRWRESSFRESYELYKELDGTEDPMLEPIAGRSLRVLVDALRLYGPEGVVCSFNGGKDAVLILHLMRAALAKYLYDKMRDARRRKGGRAVSEANLDEEVPVDTLLAEGYGELLTGRCRAIYFENNQTEFQEVRDFVWDTQRQYDIDLMVFHSNFVDGLSECLGLQEEQYGNDKLAFVLGTRRGDPNCGDQGWFEPSSTWMPPFMRVNPILDWDYGSVWHFLRTHGLPYCRLYDEGYTSLGRKDNTWKNPALRNEDGSYQPAYLLADWAKERAGRIPTGETTLECELRDIDARRRKIKEARSASLVVIGDEILKGKTSDANTYTATKELRATGIPLRRVSVVSDDEDEIAEEVRRQSQKFDVVITSGGIGPTHDDVTVRAVAKAFGQRMAINNDMLNRIKLAFRINDGQPLTSAQRKMAWLPEFATLRTAPSSAGAKEWPILQCENVFILPGVPEFFRKKVEIICRHFLTSNPIFAKRVVLRAVEEKIAAHLDATVEEHQEVTFGSYPFFHHASFKTIITLEAAEETKVEAALEALLGRLDAEWIVKVEDSDTLSVKSDEMAAAAPPTQNQEEQRAASPSRTEATIHTD